MLPKHLIDIDRVLQEKMGDKARRVPKFAVRLLKRLVHQDELNIYLEQIGDKRGVPWLKDCVKHLDFHIEVRGAENLPAPAEAPHCTFVSNHPLGGPDGIILGAVLGEHFDGRIRYLVNDLLMELYGLAPLCVGINKTGRQGREFPAQVDAAFRGDNAIIMFPAGLCSRKQNGQIHDLPWQKAFVVKSKEAQRNIVPVHFSGQNSNRFYRLANICKRLGLKFNVAMLFLADEMMKNRHKTFTITFGKPIPVQTFDASRRPADWALWVEEKVYELGN